LAGGHGNSQLGLDATVIGGDLVVTTAADGRVGSMRGTAVLETASGARASVTFAIGRVGFFPLWAGTVRIVDPEAGIDARVDTLTVIDGRPSDGLPNGRALYLHPVAPWFGQITWSVRLHAP
jgi:hypothetical protein